MANIKRTPEDVLRAYDADETVDLDDLAAALRETLAENEALGKHAMQLRDRLVATEIERDALRVELCTRLAGAEDELENCKVTFEAMEAENKRLLDAAEENFALVKGEITQLRARLEKAEAVMRAGDRLAFRVEEVAEYREDAFALQDMVAAYEEEGPWKNGSD